MLTDKEFEDAFDRILARASVVLFASGVVALLVVTIKEIVQ